MASLTRPHHLYGNACGTFASVNALGRASAGNDLLTVIHEFRFSCQSWPGGCMWNSFSWQISAWMEGSLIGRGLFLGFPTSHLRHPQFSQSKRMVPVQPLSILDIGLHVVRPKQIIWILVMIRFLTIGGDFTSSPPSTSAATSVQSDQRELGLIVADGLGRGPQRCSVPPCV